MPLSQTSPKILSVGLSTPESSFTQKEIATMMGVNDQKALRFFEHEHIKTRHLILPNANPSIAFKEETPKELREKFLNHSLELIQSALKVALEKAQLQQSQIDYLVVVTSTAFIVPGLSAHVIEKLKLKNNCQRVDIVGMGCNAGLNGLNAVANWCSNNPEKIGVLICCELCSCIYSIEETENAAIVNSLFGDGVAVCLLKASQSPNDTALASIVDFESHIIPDTLPLLRFNWNEEKNKHSFYVDKKTPASLANEIHYPLQNILEKNKLNINQINHWIVHSGGAAILDAIENKLALANNPFKHTRTVLKSHGNISSGSFLFSYHELLKENSIQPGDNGIMITMGPGLTIEMALVKW